MASLEQKIMANVGAIYTARQLLSGTALRIYICLAALGLLGRLVWVERIFTNFAQTGDWLAFVMDAILTTELSVQIIFTVLVVVGAWVSRDLVRLAAPSNRFA